MTLPKIKHPLFTMVMPSTKKEVTFRPFLVAEEKILLMAQQSGSDKDIVLAIKQILNNVIQDKWFNPKDLTTFDLEYMFLKLRAKSVNNIIEMSFIDTEDNEKYDFKVDLDQVEVEFPEQSNKVSIDENAGIILKYPSIDMVNAIPDGIDYLDVIDLLILGCVDKIYDSENIYEANEHSVEELKEFLNSLNVHVYEGIRKFFDNMPKVVYKIKYVNSFNHDREVELNTLKDFFTWG